jgi:putative flippase GtrA
MNINRGAIATRHDSERFEDTLLLSRYTLKQFILFAAIGGIGTAGQYVTLIALVETQLLKAIPASVVGFSVGAVINYFLNYKFTFNSNKSHKEAMTKFFIVAVIGALINTGLMYVGINRLHIYYLLAQIVATGIVLLWNFTANKLWTFRLET